MVYMQIGCMQMHGEKHSSPWGKSLLVQVWFEMTYLSNSAAFLQPFLQILDLEATMERKMPQCIAFNSNNKIPNDKKSLELQFSLLIFSRDEYLIDTSK